MKDENVQSAIRTELESEQEDGQGPDGRPLGDQEDLKNFRLTLSPFSLCLSVAMLNLRLLSAGLMLARSPGLYEEDAIGEAGRNGGG
jgi:hypothetical protein